MTRALLIPVVALMGWLSLALPSAVAAQPARADQEARALFEAGSVAFDEGRYLNALEHFRRAYELSDRAQLLYNIGVAAERLRRDEEALAAFREFLERMPDTDQRAAVEARIAILDAALADSPASPPPTTSEAPVGDTTPETTPPPSMETSAPDATGPIVLMASGGAVAIGGAVLLGLAMADVSSIENAALGSRWQSVEEAYSRAEPLSIAGGIALGVGAAAAVGGLVWLLLPGEATPSVSAGDVTVEVRAGIGSIALRGSF